MLREWVVDGGGLYRYFGEQGLPAGIQECLERFHRRCVDYLSRQFVPKWDCPNGEGPHSSLDDKPMCPFQIFSKGYRVRRFQCHSNNSNNAAFINCLGFKRAQVAFLIKTNSVGSTPLNV